MKLFIKNLQIEMELKNKGTEIAVCDSNEKQIGDLIIQKRGLVWCKGKTKPENGKKITWDDFIQYMNNLP